MPTFHIPRSDQQQALFKALSNDYESAATLAKRAGMTLKSVSHYLSIMLGIDRKGYQADSSHQRWLYRRKQSLTSSI